jgi:hypothetical protein
MGASPLEGRLELTAAGCYVVASASVIVPVLWPLGVSASTTDARQLKSDSGESLVAVGDDVRMQGGFVEPPFEDPCFAGSVRPWEAQTVEHVDAST